MRDIRDRLGTAIMMITHDLGVVADIADRVLVLYAGRKAEEAPVHDLFAEPQHPYTIALLDAIPRTEDGEPAAARDSRPRPAAPRAAGRTARSPTAARAPTASPARTSRSFAPSRPAISSPASIRVPQ